MSVITISYIGILYKDYFHQLSPMKSNARREALMESRKMERKKGRKLYRQKQVRQIRTLMRNTNWTAAQAMDACGISKNEQKKLMLIL